MDVQRKSETYRDLQ